MSVTWSSFDERIRERDERIALALGEMEMRGRERNRIEALEARVAELERRLQAEEQVDTTILCLYCHQPGHTAVNCVDDGPPESYADLPRCGFCKSLKVLEYCRTPGCPDSEEAHEADLDGDHD